MNIYLILIRSLKNDVERPPKIESVFFFTWQKPDQLEKSNLGLWWLERFPDQQSGGHCSLGGFYRGSFDYDSCGAGLFWREWAGLS